MPDRFYVYEYKKGSHSAKALADALGGKRIKHQSSNFKPRSWKHVINWGSCQCPPEYNAVNPSSLTTITRDKLKTFRLFKAVADYWSGQPPGSSETAIGAVLAPRVPRWTVSRQEALEWLSKPITEGGVKKVVCRATVTGQSGSGISTITRNAPGEPPPDLPAVPLYVEYISKDAEYRLHLMKIRGKIEVIDVQRKIRDPEREPTDWNVRSHANGFIFARSGGDGRPYVETLPEDVRIQATRAMACSGLDFSAIDVIWNAKKNQAYILELNSAVGLEGQTIEIYRDAFKRMFNV